MKIRKVIFKAKNILSIIPNQSEVINDFRPLLVKVLRIIEVRLKPQESQVQNIDTIDIFYFCLWCFAFPSFLLALAKIN